MLSQKIEIVFKKYNGTLTTKIAEKYGINKETLRKASLRGDIEHYSRGVYVLPDAMQDDYFSTQAQKPKGIYSHESALMLWDYGTYIPKKYNMTFPRGYNSKNFKRDQIQPYFVSPEVHELGLVTVESHLGNTLYVYNKERTILDMLHKTKVRTFTIEEMLDEYAYDENKNLNRLNEYARLLKRTHLLKEVEDYVK